MDSSLNSCAPDGLFNVDQAYVHDFQSPFGRISPPASLQEEERRSSLIGIFTDNTSQSYNYPADDEFCPLQLWADHAPHPSPPDVTYTESPVKRRRAEIDPLLLLDDDVRAAQMLSSGLSSHGAFAPSQPNEFSFNQPDDALYPVAQTMPDSAILSLPLCDLYSGNHMTYVFDGHFLLQSKQQGSSLHPNVDSESRFNLPEFKFNEGIRRKILEDARSRLPTGELVEALFPNIDDLNHFFTGYIQCFHRHFPILHLSSLDVRETPSPLIFAMCSIGAQYRLARQKAKNLFALAGTMSSYALRAGLPITTGTPKPGPLWVMQTRVLLSLCGMFSGKTNVVMRTVENLGLFAIDYRLRRSLLNLDTGETLVWEDWIGRESSKRLLCGMFIVSNLISTTFGINPGFSHTNDLDFEMLYEESLWNARSAQEWNQLKSPQPRVTIRETMAHMIFNEFPPELQQPFPVRISSFTRLLMMHAVNIHMWNLLQITRSASSKFHDTILRSAFSTLSRCEALVSIAFGNDKPDNFLTATASDSLMFNSQALLRIAYIRLFSSTNSFDRLTLLSDNPQDIATAVQAYVIAPQKRDFNINLMQSVTKAFEMLLITVKIGYLLLRKTAALSWSIEHAIAGWDAALFLTKWVHSIELEALIIPPSTEESDVLEDLRNVLKEVGEYDENGSLAAQIAGFCASTLDDCWVWGVTPRMGNVLMQLAGAYERDYRGLLGGER
jgi:hypothetical protein